jgi:hypothetical protein
MSSWPRSITASRMLNARARPPSHATPPLSERRRSSASRNSRRKTSGAGCASDGLSRFAIVAGGRRPWHWRPSTTFSDAPARPGRFRFAGLILGMSRGFLWARIEIISQLGNCRSVSFREHNPFELKSSVRYKSSHALQSEGPSGRCRVLSITRDGAVIWPWLGSRRRGHCVGSHPVGRRRLHARRSSPDLTTPPASMKSTQLRWGGASWQLGSSHCSCS